MIAPEGFTTPPAKSHAAMRAELQLLVEHASNSARNFWFPLGVALGAGGMALLSTYLEHKFPFHP